MKVSRSCAAPQQNARAGLCPFATEWKGALLAALLWSAMTGSLVAQMNMGPYFTAININYPLEKHSVVLMALPDFQAASIGPDFATGMLMAEYGITSRWTAGVMLEGQKISGYDLAPRWSVRVEPAFGLSRVSDPFMLRTGVAYTFGGGMSNADGQARGHM